MREFVFWSSVVGTHFFWAAPRRFCRSASGKEQVPLWVCEAQYHQDLQRARRLLSLRMDAEGRERSSVRLSLLSSDEELTYFAQGRMPEGFRRRKSLKGIPRITRLAERVL